MNQTRYSLGAILFHWLIAIAVIVNWRIAESAENLADAERGEVMAGHFALGMAILLLTVGRIVWRLTHRSPPMRSSMRAWEKALARIVHTLFYVLLVALPLLGWIGLSGYKYAIDMYGISWPVLPVGFGESTGHEILELHGALASAMLLLIVLHVLGALKHHLFDKDGNLYRMLPFGTSKS